MHIFLSYSRENTVYMEGVEKALKPLVRDKKITLWIDKNNILPSYFLNKKIIAQIKKADIVLLLLSVDFWASEYIRDRELPLILSEHQKRGVLIYPIILEDIKDYTKHAELKEITAAPFDENGKLTPIVDFKVINRAYNQISEDIERLSKKLLFNPYKHLFYFETEDSENFYGREEESKKVAISILNNKMTALVGESGVGKTSLIFAGVFPILNRNKDFKPIYIRCRQDLVKSLDSTLANKLDINNNNLTTTDILKQFIENNNSKLLLIFDQFEEIFITVNSKDREYFFNTLLYNIKEEVADVYILFSMRDDYFKELNRYRDKFKELWNSAIFLYRLEKNNAIKAIINPISEENISIELAEKIYNDLLQTEVENTNNSIHGNVFTPLLELVMSDLYTKALSQNSIKITNDLYNNLGGAKNILDDHFNKIFNQFDIEDIQILNQLLPFFITKEETKNSISKEKINIHFTDKKIQKIVYSLLEILIDSRLIRHIKDTEDYYELTHDMLIEPILGRLKEIPPDEPIVDIFSQIQSSNKLFENIQQPQTIKDIVNKKRFTFSSTKKYKAFIAYSHNDEKFGSELHRYLETYKIPKRLYEDYPTLPKSLYPIFRDLYELKVGDNLGVEMTKAILNSNTLIVICSTSSANSKWVNKEIIDFKMAHGEERIFPIIINGQPFAKESDNFNDSEECFPDALKYKIDSEGNLSNEPTDILATNISEKADGKEVAKFKLIAGLLDVSFDIFYRRVLEQKRKGRIRNIATGGLIFILIIVLTVFSWFQSDKAIKNQKIAIEETKKANDKHIKVEKLLLEVHKLEVKYNECIKSKKCNKPTNAIY